MEESFKNIAVCKIGLFYSIIIRVFLNKCIYSILYEKLDPQSIIKSQRALGLSVSVAVCSEYDDQHTKAQTQFYFLVAGS